MEDQSEEAKQTSSAVEGKDIEMTDEEEEQQKKEVEALAKKYQQIKRQQPQVELGSDDGIPQNKEIQQ